MSSIVDTYTINQTTTYGQLEGSLMKFGKKKVFLYNKNNVSISEAVLNAAISQAHSNGHTITWTSQRNQDIQLLPGEPVSYYVQVTKISTITISPLN